MRALESSREFGARGNHVYFYIVSQQFAEALTEHFAASEDRRKAYKRDAFHGIRRRRG
jgi:hypothetical protein